ncbi:Acyl-CoA wax alcohol acyltransferase 2 [Tupaia chinensis]|uniref:Acyl-CoA wax alcohol acyltransferase 2 n=1 Tax=Tupaia chinensis TaxID=246437 RepID=L8Y1K5_TUPCH|nr:Acyl-CoA wax alcohol acyltransferase 2 [Tupaia chinensis]
MLMPSKKDLKTAMEVFALFQWALSAFLIVSIVIFVNLYLVVFTPYWPVTVLILTWLAFDWKTPERATSGFSKIFPGITPYMLTLGAFFWVPIFRDYVMSTGACSVSQSSMDFLLTRKGTGNMLIVVVGGLAECRYSLPGSSTLVLKNRFGFVRVALRHGVALIPSYAFGETDLYNQHIFTPEGLVNRFQKWFQSIVKIYPCAFYGRGFTKNSWGLLPYTRPVTTVIGEPLQLPKIENPSQEIVAKYHELYIDALRKLFDQFKTKFGFSETQELVIV